MTAPSLPPHLVARLARAALLEDIGAGDLTTRAVVPAGTRCRALIVAESPLVVAGTEVARAAFLLLDPAARVACRVAPGVEAAPGTTVMEIAGSAAALLAAERTALNFLARLSGIATLTRQCVRAVEGTGATVYDTRKTTPGLRLLEKQAVACGGGRNHRLGLDTGVMIKDNHLALAGGVAPAVRAARAALGAGVPIEVEVESLAGLDEAIGAGADIILLDNMPPPAVAEAVARARAGGRRIELEASGGITPENIRVYAETGVDRISLGMLTHSAPAAALGMAVRPG